MKQRTQKPVPEALIQINTEDTMVSVSSTGVGVVLTLMDRLKGTTVHAPLNPLECSVLESAIALGGHRVEEDDDEEDD